MLSYRHSFHAGNHADVLKHLCQMLLIDKLKSKDKGFTYFDTHSGAGMYDLASEEAIKTGESKEGIGKLVNYSSQQQGITDYLNLVSAYQAYGRYPGSPEIANAMLRPQDKMILIEKHNQEIHKLRSNLNAKNIAIHHRDAYEGLLALAPPQIKRGLVLIDPSYELPAEYDQVVETVIKAYKRWDTATYAIWYPLLSDRKTCIQPSISGTSKKGKSEGMLEVLRKQKIFKNLLNVELCVTSKSTGEGMYGSGLAIINATWQLDKQVQQCLVELLPLLSQGSGSYKVDWLIQE